VLEILCLSSEVEVTSRLTVIQSLCLGVEPTLGLGMLLSESCSLVSVECRL
jgi:hypothetical protein